MLRAPVTAGWAALIAASVCSPLHAQIAQDDTAARGGVFLAPLGLLASPESDLASVVGPTSLELSFGVGDNTTLGLQAGYAGGSTGDIDVSSYHGGIGLQFFPNAPRYEGMYLSPLFVVGTAKATGTGDVDVSVDATLLGVFGLVGYQWNWRPFSLRVGGGAGYVSVDVEGSDGDAADVSASGAVARLDVSIGLTWGARTPQARETKRSARNRRRAQKARRKRVMSKRVRTTVAQQTTGDMHVEVEHLTPGSHLELKATRTGDKITMRGCVRFRLHLDDKSTRIATVAEVRSVDGKIVERQTGRIDEAMLANIAKASTAVLDICGKLVRLTGGFKAELASALARGLDPGKRSTSPPDPPPTVGAPDGVLKAKVALDGIDLFFEATPGTADAVVLLGLRVLTSGGAPSEDCKVDLLADGTPIEVTPYKREQTSKATLYRTTMTPAELEKASTAERIVGKICDLRFSLGERERKQVRDFITRFKEERAFADPADPADPAK